MAFAVDNGSRVRFWLDKWYGDEPLRDMFPTLLTLVVSKEAWVHEIWNGSTEGGCWTPCLYRN